jgi:hypothetical protein
MAIGYSNALGMLRQMEAFAHVRSLGLIISLLLKN